MVNYASKTALESNFYAAGLSGDAVSATANGASLDRETVDALPGGPYPEAFLLVHVEAITGAPTAISLTFQIQHSDDNSAWTQVTELANVEATSLVVTGVGFKTLALRPPGLKRYRRAILSAITLTGGSSPSVKLRSTWVLTAGRQV